MKTFFRLSARRRAALLLCFFLYCGSIFAQSPSCNLSGDVFVCKGQLGEYHIDVENVSDYIVQWNFPQGVVMGHNNELAMVHWETPGIVTAVATVYNANNNTLVTSCSIDIEIENLPGPQIVPEYLPEARCLIKDKIELFTTGYCIGSEARFFPVGGSNSEFNWTLNGLPLSNMAPDGSVLVEMEQTGTFELCLKETNQAGCSAQVCKTYHVYALPEVNISELSHGSDNEINICKNEDLLFTGSYEHPDGFSIGAWYWTITAQGDNTVLATGYQSAFDYTFAMSGIYEVHLYATNCLGCASEAKTVTVHVSEDIRPEIICPSVVCQSDSAVRYCTPASCASYTWSVSGGNIQGPDNTSCVDVIWNMPLAEGFGWVTLLPVKCAEGICTEPATVEVPVIPVMQPVSGPTDICDPSSTLTYSVPYWPGAIYTWSTEIEPGSSGTVSAPQSNGLPSTSVKLTNFNGAFRIKVRIQHPVSLCDVNSELVVQVRNFQITGPSSACPGEDLTQALTPTPASLPYTIKWEVVGTSFSSTLGNIPNVVIPAGAFPESGTYVLKATLTFQGQEPFSCDALSRFITIKPATPPVDEIIGPRMVCPGQFYEYSANPATPGTFSWSITGGTLLDNLSSTVNVIWDANQPDYSLTVIRSALNCPSEPYTADDITEINSTTLTILGPATVCEDAIAIYTANIDGASFYDWSINTDAVTILSGQGTKQIAVQWHQGATNATIQVGSQVCGLPANATLPVSINSNAVNLPCPVEGCRVCANEEVTFTAANNDNAAVFDWLVNGNQLVTDSPDNTFTTTFTQAGTQYIRVRMTGGPACPGTFEDVVAVDVMPNPEPILTYDRTVDCKHVAPVNIFSTTYQGADSETFTWSWDGGTLSPPVYTVSGPQLTIDGATWDDYEGEFSVLTTRVIDGLTCHAGSKINLECRDGFIVPDSLPDIEFTSWEFDLGQPCTTCRSATPNACGYVVVHGSLLGQSFGNVESADWRVFDYNNGLNPDDVFPADNAPSQIDAMNISVFSKAGYYPTTLRVKFLDVSSNLYDQRTIKIPIQPGFSWSLGCNEDPGMYDVLLRDISERVPGVGITGRNWDIEVLGGATETVTNEPHVTLLKTLPAGSLVKVCITPFADGNGVDMIDQHYFCTYCDTILIPAAPAVHIRADRSTVCSGTSVQFGVEGTGQGEIISYDWDFRDGTGSSLPNPIKSFATTPPFPVTLTVLTSTGCTLTDMLEITVHPVGDLDGAIEVLNDPCGSSAALMFNSTNTVESYEWNTGDTTHAIFVMQSGSYEVTVTDEFGCSVTRETYVELNAPFASTLTDTAFCEGYGGSIMFKGTPGYTYVWTTDIPDLDPKDNAETVEIPASTPYGTYHVSVQAFLENRPCMTIDATITIYPVPPSPVFEIDYTCDPFTAHVSTDPEQTLAWKDPSNNYLGFLSEFYTGVPGLYEATALNIYGCAVTASIEVLGPPNVDILSGCYELCDTLLKQDTICLQPPPGLFDRWDWTLNGTSILGGSGMAEPLCLTKDMNGKILFNVIKHYNNVNFEDIDCEAVSDTFCLEVLECVEEVDCPSTTFQNSLSTLQCVLGGDDFDEQVAMVSNIEIPYPAGYTYCTVPPVIKITSGGYFTNLVTQVYTSKIKIVSGYLHITDPVAYSTGLPGFVLLCDGVTHDTCPVTFQIDGDECDEPIWCMLMGNPTLQYTDGYGQHIKLTIQFPLHFVTGSMCNITKYNVELYDDEGGLFYQTSFSATPPPSVDMLATIMLSMTTEEYKKLKLHCGTMHISSECGSLSCDVEFCVPTEPTPLEGRNSREEPVFSSSLDIVPNPASNMLTIKYGLTEGQQADTGIEICNVLGQTVFRRYDSTAQGNLQIDVSEWQAGLYFVNLVAGSKKIAVKKVVKQ